jgi:hypothetical protein
METPQQCLQPPWGEWPWVRSRQDNCLIKLLHAASSEDQKQAKLKVWAKGRWSICQKNEYLNTLDSAIVGARSRKLNERVGVTKEFLADKDRDKPWLVYLVCHSSFQCCLFDGYTYSWYFIAFHGFYEVLLRVFWCCVLRALLQGRWTIQMEDTKEVVSVRPASKRHLIDGCEAFFPSYFGWRSYFQGVEPHQICDGIPYVFSSASISISFSMYIYTLHNNIQKYNTVQ